MTTLLALLAAVVTPSIVWRTIGRTMVKAASPRPDEPGDLGGRTPKAAHSIESSTVTEPPPWEAQA